MDFRADMMWQDIRPRDRREPGTVREVKVATLSQNAPQAATATKNQSSTPLNQSHDKLKHGVIVDSNPKQVTRPTDPIKPPATLHWKLLPFDAQRSKGKLRFDFAREVDEITLAESHGTRPLSVLERNKPAANPGLKEMVIHCPELPDWPVYVVRQSGIRCVDVFEAIYDTYNVVLTSMERSNHQARVRDIERRRPPTPGGTKEDVRRHDLLEGKTVFLGLVWITSDFRYPDGCWCLKVGPIFL